MQIIWLFELDEGECGIARGHSSFYRAAVASSSVEIHLLHVLLPEEGEH